MGIFNGVRTIRARALLVVPALLTFGACNAAPVFETRVFDELPEPVAAIEAEIGNIRAVVRTGGVVVGQEGAEFRVVAPAPARILEITRDVGDAVVSGDLLVRFELTEADFELTRRTTELTQAQSRLESARSVHSRAQDFVQRGLLPRRDLEDAERELVEAETALRRAETGIAAAESAAARATVVAPFDGVVAERQQNPGDLAQPFSGAPVLRVVDPNRLEVVARLEQKDTSRVLPGARAVVTTPLRPDPIRLTVAGPPQLAQIDANGLVPVRLAFNEPVAIAVDTPLALEIDAEEHVDVVLVPLEAVLQQGDDPELFVYVVNDESRAERRVVTVGLSDDQRAEITDGLVGGELVVVRGQEVLQEGMLVTADVPQ